jgi:hypothetical protein
MLLTSATAAEGSLAVADTARPEGRRIRHPWRMDRKPDDDPW